MTGMGRNANQAIDGAITKNVPPINTTVVSTWSTSFAPVFQLIDVVVEDCHQVAARLILEVRHFELLNVGVCVEPQLVLYRLGQVAPSYSEQVLKERLETEHEHGQDGEYDQL
jgi:hypothetical protein